MKKVKKKGKESGEREAGARTSVTRNETGERGRPVPRPADPGPLGQLASRITRLLSAPRLALPGGQSPTPRLPLLSPGWASEGSTQDPSSKFRLSGIVGDPLKRVFLDFDLRKDSSRPG